MIMPGVQKPHWSPCFSQKPCWIGCSSPFLARPSIVVMVAPSAWTANIVHAFTAWPFMRIVHAVKACTMFAVQADGAHRARLHRLAVHEDRARPGGEGV